MDRERVVIAEILRPRGNRGEVLARSETDVAGRFEQLKRARVRLADGSDVTVDIEAAWKHKSGWIFRFAGVDSIAAAERFRDADIWVPLADRAPIGEAEFFQSDLIGCNVVEKASGSCIGVVEGWQQYGGPLLMEVNAGGRSVLIPFVTSICLGVDIPARTISVDLPEGLLDL